ncbi:MAG: rod shape-determining protein MreD [Pseudomonadota bacterium]
MGSAASSYVWGMRGAYLGTGLLLLFLQLLPLETAPRGWVGPDFLLALTFVWVARRPDLAPVTLVAAMFLLADLLLQRPPGLWAALALVATELVRLRAHDFRDMIFPAEWAIVSAYTVVFYLAFMLVWSIAMTYDISYPMLLLQALLTCLAYPLVAAASSAFLGVTKAAPGQTDAQGRKL